MKLHQLVALRNELSKAVDLSVIQQKLEENSNRILSTSINGNTVELSTVDINSGVYCIVIHNRYGMKQFIHTLIKSQ